MRRLFFASCLTITLTSATLGQTHQSDEPAVNAPQETSETTAGTSESESQVENQPFSLTTTDRLTGDWFGGRKWLEDHGIDFGIYLTSIYQHNAHGGLQVHNGHRITGSADYELSLDTEGLGLWKGGTWYFAAESSWNESISGDRVGNLFEVNTDAVADYSIVLHEAWYEHSFDGKARFKLGKIDLTSDFDTNAYANDETAQFLNTALVSTGNIPFPDFGLGAQFILEPTDWFYAGIAAADAQADGRETGFNTAFHDEDHFFSVAEFGFLPVWNTAWGKLPGGYRFGMWYDPQPKEIYFDDLNGRRRTVPLKRDDAGFYFNMDQLLIKEKPQDEADSQGLGMFFRYGFAHGNVNEIQNYWAIGGQYQGLIPTRDNDVLAFGVAQGLITERVIKIDERAHRETVLETYYNIALTPWLNISPDFQWILDPGGRFTGHDAFVAGVRVQASF